VAVYTHYEASFPKVGAPKGDVPGRRLHMPGRRDTDRDLFIGVLDGAAASVAARRPVAESTITAPPAMTRAIVQCPLVIPMVGFIAPPYLVVDDSS
jgi:hypothetical protein